MGSALQLPEGIADGARVYEESFLDGLREDRIDSIVEWAEKHHYLPDKASNEKGLINLDRTPHIKEILECFSPRSPVREVWFMKGAQVAGTTAIEIWFHYLMANAGGPSMLVRPTKDSAEDFSNQRLQPTIDASEVLVGKVAIERSRSSRNKILFKDFVGGFLKMVGANSPAGLKSAAIKNLAEDEIDEFKRDIGRQGDPMDLADARTSTFQTNRKIFGASTPTIKGASNIERAYLKGDQRRRYIPCPNCGEYQPIEWRYIKWEGDDARTRDVWLECRGCEGRIDEYMKPKLLAAGRWVPTARSEKPNVRSYHISSLYSPLGWYSWKDAVTDFLRAKREGREALKVWTNRVLGETWEEAGDSVEASFVMQRREAYKAPAPDGVLALTAGVDVQADRLELEVVGWGLGEESWSVDYRVLWGDTTEKAVWAQLDDVILSGRYRHEHGDLMPISATMVDSGYNAQVVYQYCKDRHARNVWASKGVAGHNVQMVEPVKKRRIINTTGYAKVHILGVDQLKGIIYSRLRLLDRGPGFCHFPADDAHDVEYFAQLCAEKRGLKYRKGFPFYEWTVIRPGGRNEVLDARVYAYAALLKLNPMWVALERRRAKIRARLAGDHEAVEVEEVRKKGRRKRRKGRQPAEDFVNRYRKGGR